jgi:Zn-dependent protease
MFILNLLLGTFNLIPVPPLDGHAGIMVLMPEGAAKRYLDLIRQTSGYSMIGIVIAWRLFDQIFRPIFLFALHILYAGGHKG